MQRLGDSGTLGVGETTIAAASTTDLGTSKTRDVLISGSTTIASFGATPNRDYRVRFSASLLLTHNATSLVLPTAANITTLPGDTALVESDPSGNWRVTAYQRSTGVSLGLTTTGAVSFRNRIRNGNFSINQRLVSGTVTLAAGVYGHDGWKGGASGGTYTFSAGVVTITANTLLQIIEGALYLPEGGTYTLSWAGTAQARINGGTYAASPVTVTGLTAGANATIEFATGTVSLVQFEPGVSPTIYEYRNDEQSRAERYYERFGGATYSKIAVCIAVSATVAFGLITYRIKKRIAPSVTSGGTLYLYNGTSFTMSALIADATDTNSMSVRLTSSGMATGSCYFLSANNDANAYVALSAEL